MKQFLLGIIAGLLVGTTLTLLSKGLPKTSLTIPVSTTPRKIEGMRDSSLHFAFQYPNGWHVFSNGTIFYLDSEPLYDFPHQKYKLVEGMATETKAKDLAGLAKDKKFKSLTVTTSNEMKNRITCAENSTKEEVDGPFTALDGRIVCFVDVPWGSEAAGTTITYKLTGNNTNDQENRQTFLQFIESIKPVE